MTGLASNLSHIARALPVAQPAETATAAADLLRPLAQQVGEVERRAIAAAMQACHGNKLAAARMLGISRAKLYERIELSEIKTNVS